MRFQHFWTSNWPNMGPFKKYFSWGRERGGGGGGEGDGVVGSLKSEQKQIREAGSQHESTFAFLKKWSFIVILQFFLLIVMAVWNIKQTIMKDYNVQSCQWMACDRFRQPFLLCTTFRSFLCTVHYFLCAFSAKMATYSLVIDICTSWSVVKCTNVVNLVWRL